MINFADNMHLMAQLIPELEPLVTMRYQILNAVRYAQPIGRRALAQKLDLSERIARKECTVLRDLGHLDFSVEGMTLTAKGYKMLNLVGDYMDYSSELGALGRRLAKKVGITRMSIVPDAPDEPAIVEAIGQRCAEIMSTFLADAKILGITGGSTVAALVGAIGKSAYHYPDLTVVPARGGIGDETRHQANSLAEQLARDLGAKHHSLFIPDSLSARSIEQLKKEPSVAHIMAQIEQIDSLVFGVGLAKTLATRRGLDDVRIADILKKGAVAEAFGYYFNRSGQIVDEISTFGISLEKFKTIRRVIAVAGGKDKAEAIIAVSQLNPNIIVITNESAAIEIASLVN